jgi:hypothetical protein
MTGKPVLHSQQGNDVLNALPSSSFVSIKVRRLRAAAQVWKNREIANHLNLADYQYCIPQASDPQQCFGEEEATALGERYGGQRIVNNGGGVRCGLIDSIQIKGIGSNCLAGRNRSFWYSHGGAGLEEAIREAIWGEVCNVALPFGAVRVYGILDTGMKTSFPGPGDTVLDVTRALILREAALRPAHYLRAIYFEPDDDFVSNYCTDVIRTKEAIRRLGQGMQAALGTAAGTPESAQAYNEGLHEMTRRFAGQLAAARAKRIMHGTVNCSNICLDGRYIDFGTISSLSDHGRVKIARNNPDQWKAHTKLHPTLRYLSYYMKKYLAGGMADDIASGDDLIAAFDREYGRRLVIEFVKLTGIPERRIRLLPKECVRELYQCMSAIWARGNEEPFKATAEAPMPATMGAYHLNSVLGAACLVDMPQDMSRAIAQMLPDEPLRARFVRCFHAARDHYLQTFRESDRPMARLFAALNAVRLNMDSPELYRHNLIDAINGHLEAGITEDATTRFIESHVDKARTVLGDSTAAGIDLRWFCGRQVRLAESGILDDTGREIGSSRLVGMLNDKLFSREEKNLLLELAR